MKNRGHCHFKRNKHWEVKFRFIQWLKVIKLGKQKQKLAEQFQNTISKS